MPNNCKYENCKERASYGFYFQKPEYCTKHGILMKAYPQYRICMCGKARPHSGYPGDTRASACKHCILSGMINIASKKCEEETCNSVTPRFGFPNNTARYCSKHKKEGMVCVLKVKICNDENCKKHVGYDFPGGKGAYCAKHKKEGMIDIKHPICKESGCTVINPIFNFSGKKGEYCNTHKKDGMINVRNKCCKHVNCNLRPSYGFPGMSPEYCSKHKKDKMIIRTDILCIEPECNKYAAFGYNNQKPMYCFTHKKENMDNITVRRCPGPPGLQGPDGKCPLNKTSNRKYNYYCCECFVRAFPNDPRSLLVYKRSDELLVRDFINLNFKEYKFVHDTTMWINGCNCTHKRRVDLRVLIGNTILAIEIDEHQHKDRDTIDEEVRYDDLYMIHSGKWIFIRYNPHSYMNNDGKRVNPHKEGRLRILQKEVETQIERIKNDKNTDLLEVHKLFYDNFER